MRKKPKMIHVEADQIPPLLQSPAWKRDDALYKALMDAKKDTGFKTFEAVYVNEQRDEVLLEYEYGWGTLFSFESFDGFVSRLRRPIQYRTGHIMEFRFLYGASFPGQVTQLVQQLPELMGLSPDVLDFTFESLQSFDRILMESDLEEALEAHIFPVLVAYCGEILRRVIHGEWDMRRAQVDPNIWEVWVRSTDGAAIDVGNAVYTSLEEDVPFSLEGRIRAEYQLWHLRRGSQSE
jgi:hypothetical protein